MLNSLRRCRPFFFILLACLLASASWAQKTNFENHARWEKDMLAFEAADKTNPPPQHAILFIGSSSIKRWTNIASAFPEQKIINRGFGGSFLSDSVYFFDRIVAPCKPRVIVLFAGSNDINAGKTPQKVCGDFKEFVAKAEKALPQTRVIYVSITTSPSRWNQIDKVRETNRLIEDYVKTKPSLTFVNLLPHLLGDDGKPRPELYGNDHLHPNAKGYAVWIDVLGPYLR